eukprot:403365986
MHMREVYCPDDKEVSTLAEVLKENKQILRKLESLDQLTLFCDDHEGQIANLYCTACQIPVCCHCKLEQQTHKAHSLIDLKQSDFKTYAQNVISLFDEYSIENMKTKLINQSMNEIQLKSSQFKQMIEKINRMLGHVASNEELQKIDLAYFLRDPLYAPQNKQPQRSNMMEEQKTHHNQDSENIQQLINESQSKLREEFKQALNAFEINQNNQNQVNSQINDSIKLNKTRLDNCEKTLEEFKMKIDKVSNRCEAIDIALESTNTKISSLEQIFQLQKDLNDDYSNKHKLLQNELDESKINLSEFIQSVKLDIDKHDTQLVDANSQILNERALIDTLQLKIQEINEIKPTNSSALQHQNNEYKLQQFLSNISIINEKLNKVIKKTKDIKDIDDEKFDDEELMAYQIYGKELMVQQFRLLVDFEIQKDQSSLLQNQIPDYSTKQISLLYSGSRDGFAAKDFHKLCDDKGPTVSFILSEYGQVLGGFTSIPWSSPAGWHSDLFDQSHSDPSALVFSLSKRSFQKQYQNQEEAVRHDTDWICVFGNDICIYDNCDKNSRSSCNLGYTYELPNGQQYRSDETQSYLAGQYKFKVFDIEVYQLI